MACWIFDTNVARIVVIRKLFPVILDILPSKDLFFLQIKLFNRRNTSLSPDSRFSCPMKLAERENFLISDHSSGARQVWYERGGNTLRHRQHFDEELLSDHRRVSLRSHCRIFACLQTFAVTFAEDFSAPLRTRNEMSYGYCKVTKAGAPRSFLIRSLWVSRAISIHS